VKLLDANILLYAYDSSSPRHAACRSWLDAAFNTEESVALPWQTILAFVRIATNPRAVRQPLSGPDACAIVTSWLERPNVAVIGAGGRFWEIFKAQVQNAQATGPLITDAALAALALEHGATLCTTDRDFRRFDGLKLLDPSQTERSQ
jgi:toxin-antitoxin system PIN domain toxin